MVTQTSHFAFSRSAQKWWQFKHACWNTKQKNIPKERVSELMRCVTVREQESCFSVVTSTLNVRRDVASIPDALHYTWELCHSSLGKNTSQIRLNFFNATGQGRDHVDYTQITRKGHPETRAILLTRNFRRLLILAWLRRKFEPVFKLRIHSQSFWSADSWSQWHTTGNTRALLFFEQLRFETSGNFW